LCAIQHLIVRIWTAILHYYIPVYIQWNLYLSFPDNSFSRIHRSICMVPEQIIFQLWLPHLLFSRIRCFFFRPPMKTMNRGFLVNILFLPLNSLCWDHFLYILFAMKFLKIENHCYYAIFGTVVPCIIQCAFPYDELFYSWQDRLRLAAIHDFVFGIPNSSLLLYLQELYKGYLKM
jgi:hypothetical protein